jgi:hypothetical protein
MNELGIGGGLLLVIVAILLVSGLITSLKSIWGVISPVIKVGLKSHKQRSDYDNMIIQNNTELQQLIKVTNEYVEAQKVFDNNLRKNVDDLSDTVENVCSVVEEIQLDNIRHTILDFSSAISNGRLYRRDQYHETMNLYKKYNEILRSSDKAATDEVVELSYSVIVDSYKDCVANHKFLEDRVREKISDDFDYRSYSPSIDKPKRTVRRRRKNNNDETDDK